LKLKDFRLTKSSVVIITFCFLATTCCFADDCQPDLRSISWKKDSGIIKNQKITADCFMRFMDHLLPSNFEILSDGFGEYKWLDVNNDGILELFVTTTSGRNFYNDLWIFISDKGHKRFLQHEHVWMLDDLKTAFRDFEGDGIYELIAQLYLIGDGGLARPMAIWTAIFRWNGSKFERADQLYKDFYLEKIPELQSRINEYKEKRSTLDMDDTGEKWIAESKQNADHAIAVETILRDKILRTTNRDKRAGFQTAFEWSHSDDVQMRRYAVFVFGDIFDKESRKQLEILMRDGDESVARGAASALERKDAD
jgi:hypothetical protein